MEEDRNFDAHLYFKEKLLSKINLKKITRTGWYTFNAPCCHHWKGERPDRRGRGNILFDDSGWVYNCFNCGYRTAWKDDKIGISKKTENLLRWFGFSEDEILEIKKNILKSNPDNKNTKNEPKVEITYDEWRENLNGVDFYLLKNEMNFVSLREIMKKIDEEKDSHYGRKWLKSVKYILSRGDHVFDYLDRMFFVDNNPDDLFLPLLWEKKVFGLIQRKIEEGAKRKRYLNHSFDNVQIYNLDRAIKEDVIFVTEGPFDAMALDGVAILSNSASQKQISILESIGKRICVFPDFDRAGSNLVQQALKREWDVCIFPQELIEDEKDASDLCKKFGKILFLEICYKTISSNKVKNQIFYKKLSNHR